MAMSPDLSKHRTPYPLLFSVYSTPLYFVNKILHGKLKAVDLLQVLVYFKMAEEIGSTSSETEKIESTSEQLLPPVVEEIRPSKQEEDDEASKSETEKIGSTSETKKIGSASEQLPPVLEDIRPLKQEEEAASKSETEKTGSTSEQLPPVQQQHQSRPESSTPDTKRFLPNLPRRYLLTGPRVKYLRDGVPLYEASIKCDWDAAEAILTETPGLVRYSITENGETALHVAASSKVPKKRVEVFVKNLVGLMNEEDLALENENFNTALYLAAAAGNLETVKIMVEKYRDLVAIPGAGRLMLPLYAAALFGNYDVVEYLYGKSNDLCDADGWNDNNRGWLFDKCMENDMFDIALKIMKRYPNLGTGNALAFLARKPEAFCETQSTIKGRAVKLGKYVYSKIFSKNHPSENNDSKPGSVGKHLRKKNLISFGEPLSAGAPENLDQKTEASSKEKPNIIWRTIKFFLSVFTFSGSNVKAPENESIALQLLRIIWKDIAKKPKNEIDRILRGPPDMNKQDKFAPGRAVQFMQLQKSISDHIYRVSDITRQQLNNSLNLISESLVKMHVETQNIIKGAPDSINQDNKPISGKADQALELQKIISKSIVNMHNEIQKIHEITVKEDQEAIQLRLQNAISDHIGKLKTKSQKIIRRPAKQTYSSRVVFIAAEMGNTKFLIELIRQYPDLIWKVNDNNQTIFHIAVRYRNAGIYNLLYEIGAMKDMITPLRDSKENNMLHLVGMSPKRQLDDVPGVALQMQRELLWFQEVEKMVPPSYRERRNEDGLTPRELFTKEHQEMVSEGEKWMKKIASQCIVVAALIATMVFAAAFTVPGGFDQKNGIPVFHSKVSFQIFVVTDAISLLLSTASILHMFLSIFTSHYDEGDFLVSLPKKLTVGLTYLFLSIVSMLVAFCTGFFVLYHNSLLWMPILISSFALLSFFLNVRLHLLAFFKVIFSAFISTRLFKPTKRVLYYENPKV